MTHPPQDAVMVYMTAGSRAEAEKVGGLLVTRGHAACVNIIDNMTSIYTWKGRLQRDQEVVLIAKTLAAKMPALVETVKTVHSYECPCIVSIPIAGGNPDFLAWIAETTESSS